MRTRMILTLAVLAGGGWLKADEPKRRSVIEEQFFGSNETSYALTRTESEPLADGKVRTRTWFDEYSKEAIPLPRWRRTEESRIRHAYYSTKLERSVLLLDVTRDRTGKHSDPVVQGEAKLSTALLRYPHRRLTPWPAERMEQVRTTQSSFIIRYKLQHLVNGGTIRKRMGGEGMGKAKVEELIGSRVVDAIGEDQNCVYLTLTATSAEQKQTRVFCMVPVVTRNIHAQDAKESLYLTTGQIRVKGEAVQTARELREKLDQSGFADTEIEIWTYFDGGYNRDLYFVCFTNSLELIRQRKVEALQGSLGDVSLMPMKGEAFEVRMEKLAKARD